MRRGLSLLLMVVLVLRGLTGTAMAAGVLPPLQPTAAPHGHMQADAVPVAHGAHTESTVTEPETDHDHHDHDHASVAPTTCDGASSGCAAHDHHTSACSACEICHSAMLVLAPIQN